MPLIEDYAFILYFTLASHLLRLLPECLLRLPQVNCSMIPSKLEYQDGQSPKPISSGVHSPSSVLWVYHVLLLGIKCELGCSCCKAQHQGTSGGFDSTSITPGLPPHLSAFL